LIWVLIFQLRRRDSCLKEHGCQNGRPKVKNTIQTSILSVHLRPLSRQPHPSTFTPWIQFHLQSNFYPFVQMRGPLARMLVASARTHECVCVNVGPIRTDAGNLFIYFSICVDVGPVRADEGK
jgi:hypothetical protein